MLKLTRRQLLITSAFSLANLPRFGRAAETAPSIEMDGISTISHQTDRYHGWPTLTQTADGELLVVCSGGRESHVCPFGRVELIRSRDEGKNWTYARTILDGPIDDRDAGIVQTAQGTLLATTFTSLAYEPTLERAIQSADSEKPLFDAKRLAKWQSVHNRLGSDQRNRQLGCWVIRSTDNGLTWSPPSRTPVNSPHGPINLSDGRLLYAGVKLWTPDRSVGVAVSSDDGLSWDWLAEIPTRQGDDGKAYHELHAVETASGRILVHIRNHNPKNNREILQTYSDDGGRTWCEPYPIGVWGLPSHLLRLSDGRILMSYGHRRAPIGNQVRLSEDDGASWSAPLLIQSDATSTDLGYPSTVELSLGRFATVWYERTAESSLAILRMAKWRHTL